MNVLWELIGFSENEIGHYKEEIGLFSSLLSADEKLWERAAEELPLNFDLSFESLRRLFKLLMESIFQDLGILTGRTKGPVLYQGAVPYPVSSALAVEQLNPGLRISSSEYLIIYLSGILLNRFQSFCTAGEHSCGRCGLNLSREKLYKNPLYPRPEKVFSCLGYCDEIFKTGETLSMLHGLGHCHLKGVSGLDYHSQKDYLGRGLEDMLTGLTGASAEEAERALGNCNDRMLEISLLLNRINRLSADRDVYATFNEISLLNLFHLISLPRHFEQGKEILNLFLRELKQKRRAGAAVLKEPYRIGCMHLPFTNPFMDRCFRRSGAAVIVSSFYETGGSAPGAAADLADTPKNEFERCLQGFYGNRAPGNPGEKAVHIDRIIEVYNLDSFLFGQFENDRALGGDQLLIMKKVRNQRKVHYTGMNNWSVMGERESTRIESLTALMMERDKKYKERSKYENY